MSSVWYVGSSDVRVVNSSDWDRAGVDDLGTFQWDEFNGFSIPMSSFTTQQIAWLDANDEFYVNAPDGPRTEISLQLDGFVTRAQLDAILRSAEFGTLTGLTRASVGLDEVDNTADVDKPLSTAAIAALLAKADYPTAGTDGQVLVKAGSTTAWAPPAGGGGSVGVATVTDASVPSGSTYNITGSGVASVADASVPSGTVYTVN